MIKLLSLELPKRKSPLLWSSEISSASLAARRDTERYLAAVATLPTLKSRSLHLDASILISFHAIFLLLISIHEIRSCATAVAGAISERARQRERKRKRAAVSFSFSSSMPHFFLVKCLQKVNNAFIFIASLQLINHGILALFLSRGSPLYLTTFRETCILLTFGNSCSRGPPPSLR